MKHSIDFEKFKAVLFDLDGVLTSTEKIHSACWKKMFDEFLQEKSTETGEDFVPFDLERDYLKYIDGKPRYQGVRDFLTARSINLPEGTLKSPPSEKSIMGLGNKKNKLFNEIVERDGVEVYKSSLELVKYLNNKGIKMAVVSSSRNCRQILSASKMDSFFKVVVDGIKSAELGLEGKPEPDTFLQASRQLGVNPQHAVVIEDAISGVIAGKNGEFGLVVGIARKGNFNELRENGADIIVSDLAEIVFK